MAYLVGALTQRGSIEPRLGSALALYAVGAIAAGVASAWVLPRWTGRRPWSARLAAAIAVLSALTVGLGAFALFVAVAVLQSSRWGAPFSMEWIGSMIVNGGASLIYTITLALPMLIPLGIPVMFAGAWHLARQQRLSPAVSPVRPPAPLEPESSSL